MCQGKIVDATLIAASKSTQNKVGQRDPEIHPTKKGNKCYHRFAEGFAYATKINTGVDKDSSLIYSVVVKAANVHDLTPVTELLHGYENVVNCDAGYQGTTKRPEIVGNTTEFRIAKGLGKRPALPEAS